MLCFGCFKEKNNTGACPECGYDPQSDAGKYSTALQQGSILHERYIVGRVLGQGGFGITYAALDFATQQRVAIKEFLPTSLASRTVSGTVSPYGGQMEEHFTQGKAGFLEEAHTLEQFKDNAHTVNVQDYFEENGTAYFVMDYVQGQNLKSYVKIMGGKLGEEAANRILMPIMEALGDVHAKGIVHRDIAPDNIIVTAEGSATLIDFGAARYSTGEKSMSLDVVLKHGYAPMEQYSHRSRQGPYTDVYAMAATYYYAVTGKVPPDAIERMAADSLVPPSKHGVKLSSHTEAALMKALSLQAEDRFANMEEFLKALKGEIQHETKKKQKPEKKKGGKVFAVIALLIVVVLGGAAGFLFGRGGEDVLHSAAEPTGISSGTQQSEAAGQASGPMMVEKQWEYSSISISVLDERRLHVELTDERIPDKYTNSPNPGIIEPWWNLIMDFGDAYLHVYLSGGSSQPMDELDMYYFMDYMDSASSQTEPGEGYSLQGNCFSFDFTIPEDSGYTVNDIVRFHVNHGTERSDYSEGYDVPARFKAVAALPERDAELVFEATEIYNAQDVKICVTDYIEEYEYCELKFSVENNSPRHLYLSDHIVTVNNWLAIMKANLWIELEPGQADEISLHISKEELADAGIDKITALELCIRLYDKDSYEEWYTEAVTLNIYDVEILPNALSDSGEVLYDDGSIKVVYKGKHSVDGEAFWYPDLYVENRSEYIVELYTTNMCLDGIPIQEENMYYMLGTLAPDTVGQTTVTVGWRNEDGDIVDSPETAKLSFSLVMQLYDINGNFCGELMPDISLS